MAKLSWLIGNFPAVRKAVVLFEPGKASKLGRPGTKPTAAVHVSLAHSSEMTARLVAAIADMVAGSIANLSREDVCVIDSRGRSYRAGDESLAVAEALASRHTLEEHYERRISGALGYIRNLTVAVRLDEGPQPACTGVALAVPRSHFQAVANDNQGPAAGDVDAAIVSESDRIRQAVISFIGGLGAADVTVHCYRDVPPAAAAADDNHSVSASGVLWSAGRPWASLLLAAGGAFCWCVLIRRRRRAAARRVAQEDNQPASAEANGAAPATGGENQRDSAHPLAFLADVPDEDLLWLLGGEQAQAIALVVSHLGYDRAAVVLAGLQPERQEQVIRRLVGLGQVDPQTVAAVAESLTERLNNHQRPPADAMATVVGILNHAGGATEKSILDGLSQSEPHLAWSIRSRMLTFEDIVRVPADQLCEALVSLEPYAVALALRTAGEEVRAKVLRSLPAGRARSVRRHVDRLGPVRLSEIEAAQQHVASTVRQFGPPLAAKEAVR